MIQYAAYDQTTGRILRTGLGDPNILGMLGAFIEAPGADGLLHYVWDGALQNLPPRPSPAHRWQGPTLGWVDPGDTPAVLEVRAQKLRTQRDALLVQADVRMLRALEDGADLQPLRVYRQALRDMGAQEALKDPVWPTSP